jgi:hypothetical protein
MAIPVTAAATQAITGACAGPLADVAGPWMVMAGIGHTAQRMRVMRALIDATRHGYWHSSHDGRCRCRTRWSCSVCCTVAGCTASPDKMIGCSAAEAFVIRRFDDSAEMCSLLFRQLHLCVRSSTHIVDAVLFHVLAYSLVFVPLVPSELCYDA